MNNIIKQILVQLAIDGKLPLDMNDLDENIFSEIPNDILLEELKQRKYISEHSFTIEDVNYFDKKNDLTLDEKYNILNEVFSDEVLFSEINYDIESKVENCFEKKVNEIFMNTIEDLKNKGIITNF